MNAKFDTAFREGVSERDIAQKFNTTEEVVRLVRNNYVDYERFPKGFPKCSSSAMKEKIAEQMEHLLFESEVNIIGAKNNILSILSSTLAQRESRFLNCIVVTTAILSVCFSAVSVSISTYALSSSSSAQAASTAETEKHALVIANKLDQITEIPARAPLFKIGDKLDVLVQEIQQVRSELDPELRPLNG